MSQKDCRIIECTIAVPPIYHSEPELEVYAEGKTRLKGYKRRTTPSKDIHSQLFLTFFPNRLRPIAPSNAPFDGWKSVYDEVIDEALYRSEMPFIVGKWAKNPLPKEIPKKRLTTLEKRVGNHLQEELRSLTSAYAHSIPKGSGRERYFVLQDVTEETEIGEILNKSNIRSDISKTYMRASLCVLSELVREGDPLALKYTQMLAARANRSYAEAKRHWKEVISQIGA